jgi:hypothetical protein
MDSLLPAVGLDEPSQTLIPDLRSTPLDELSDGRYDDLINGIANRYTNRGRVDVAMFDSAI